MNKDLHQRVVELLSRYETATLATCGEAGVQISNVHYRMQQIDLYLFIPNGSDHLFNLDTQPELVLLSPMWKLQGRKLDEAKNTINAPHTWQTVVAVQPIRLHIISENQQNTVETIDFNRRG